MVFIWGQLKERTGEKYRAEYPNENDWEQTDAVVSKTEEELGNALI